MVMQSYTCSKTSTLLGVGIHCRNGIASVKVKFCVN